MATNTPEDSRRRPIASRNTRWAGALCGLLLRAGIRPNVISVGSVVMAIASAGCMGTVPYLQKWGQVISLVGAAVFIQLRLICNLMDGMVAVEGKIASKLGELFNDFPDRFADGIIILGTAFIFRDSELVPELAWMAALLAVLTAYTRVVGVSIGTRPYFCGPMAKAHRMALLTVALLVTALEVALGRHYYVLEGSLMLMIVGCAVTIYRRVMLIAAELESK